MGHLDKAKFLALAAKGGKGRNVDPQVWWQLGRMLIKWGASSQVWVPRALGISRMQAYRLRLIGALPEPPKKGTTLAQAVALGKRRWTQMRASRGQIAPARDDR